MANKALPVPRENICTLKNRPQFHEYPVEVKDINRQRNWLTNESIERGKAIDKKECVKERDKTKNSEKTYTEEKRIRYNKVYYVSLIVLKVITGALESMKKIFFLENKIC